jgi:hypothetical protein
VEGFQKKTPEYLTFFSKFSIYVGIVYFMKERNMKRILTLLVVLTAGTALFAQEFKWSGYFNSGLGIAASDASGAEPYLRVFGVDAGQDGFRFRLNGAWTNAEGTAGLNFRFQSQASVFTAGTTPISTTVTTDVTTIIGGNPETGTGTGTGTGTAAYTDFNYFSLPYAYGWVKALDGVITASGGIVDDGTWDTGGFILANRDGGDQGEGLGALLKVSPITGLDLGFGAYAVSINSGSANNTLALPLNSRPKLYDVKYTANLGFTLPDVFRINASFRSKNTSGGTSNSAANTSRIVFGVKVLALKDLTAILEVEANKLDDFSDSGLFAVYETLGYKLGDLQFGLNAGQYVSKVAAQPDFSLEIDPWVSYALGSIVPRLDIVYFQGGGPGPVSTDKYGRGNVHSVTYNSTQDVLSFRPSVKFNIGSTSVEVGDAVYLNNYIGDAADSIFNVFYVDFKWSF